MDLFNFKLITPQKIVHEEEVSQLTVPTLNGEITILPNHESMITLVGKGDIVAMVKGEWVPFMAVNGVLKVQNNEVVVLADFAEPVDLISNEEAINKAILRSQQLAKDFENAAMVDFEHFETELARSLTRAHVGEKWRLRKYRK